MRIDEAIEFAVRAHTGQHRKGTDIPYITHPMAVAMLLARAGCDEEIITAGLLHDTVEDCGVSLAEIAARFGERVAAIVEGCSEPDKAAPWEARKEHTLHYLRTAPLDVKLVSCADKLHNARTIAADVAAHGEATWSRFKRGRAQQGWYYRGIVEAFRPEIEAGMYPDLFAALEAEVRALFGGP